MKKNIYTNSRTLISDEITAQSQGRAVSFYVDGFNLYHAVNKFQNKSYKWCNLRNLFNLFTDPSIETIDEIKFFTSPPKHIKTPNDTKLKNHKNYCNVLEKYCNIGVISGNFRKSDIFASIVIILDYYVQDVNLEKCIFIKYLKF